MWQSASLSSRFLLLAAVFFLFASVGLLGDITSLGRSRLCTLAIWAVFGGGTAVAYLLVIMLRLRWLPAVVVLQVRGLDAIGRIPEPGARAARAGRAGARDSASRERHGHDGLHRGSYTLFFIFVTGPGGDSSSSIRNCLSRETSIERSCRVWRTGPKASSSSACHRRAARWAATWWTS